LYVALTRARHRVWLLFNKAQPSPFVEILQALDVPVARKP
jgi:DNA helicase-4